MLIRRLLLPFLLISNNLIAQFEFLEISPNFGFWHCDIVNTNITDPEATIGEGLRKPSYGFSYIINFGLPVDDIIWGIGFNFNKSFKGSISEVYQNCKIEIPAFSFGLLGQCNYAIDWNLYIGLKMGIAIDMLDVSNYYQGNRTLQEAFPKFLDASNIKDSELLFLYSIGIKQRFFNENLFISLNIDGDAGMTKINRNAGSFTTQSLGIRIGFGILINPYTKS